MQLARFLNKVFKKSGFILTDANSKDYIIGNPGENPIKLKILDKKLHYKLLFHPDLYFGEAYTNGEIIIENGTLSDFRFYDGVLDSTAISEIYAFGPLDVDLPSPILWYKLNEDTANLGTDSSGNLNSMINVGVVSIIDTSPSNYGQVSDFSSGTLTLPSANVPSAIYGTSSRSYSFWIESAVVSNTRISDIGVKVGSGRDFGIQLDTNQNLVVSFFNIPRAESTTVMTSGVWYHVVVTFEDAGNICKIYINNTEEFSGTRNVITDQTDLEFGEFDAGFQDMRLLDMRIYDVAIGATQVSILYSNGPDMAVTSTSFTATPYTHLVDLTWDAIPGATEYTIRQVKDGSDEKDVVKTLLLTGSVNLDNSSTYVFNLYSCKARCSSCWGSCHQKRICSAVRNEATTI